MSGPSVYDPNYDARFTAIQREIGRLDALLVARDAELARLKARNERLAGALQRLLRAYESDAQLMPDQDVLTSWETNSQAIDAARAALKEQPSD